MNIGETCICDGPPHGYNPSWCIDPKKMRNGSYAPTRKDEVTVNVRVIAPEPPQRARSSQVYSCVACEGTGVTAARTDAKEGNSEDCCAVTAQEVRKKIASDLFWLSAGRGEYDDERCARESNAARILAKIVQGEDEFASKSWLPSWKWDEWEARKNVTIQPTKTEITAEQINDFLTKHQYEAYTSEKGQAFCTCGWGFQGDFSVFQQHQSEKLAEWLKTVQR